MEVKLETFGLREVREKLEKLRAQDIPHIMRQITYTIGLEVQNQAKIAIQKEHLFPRSKAKDMMDFVSLQLPTYVDDGVEWGLPRGPLMSRIGAFFNEGGTIRPRIARMLRIPLSAARTAGGVDRYDGVKLRKVKGFRIVKLHGVALFLARDDDSNPNEAHLWYHLVPQVTIKAMPWFNRAVEKTRSQVPRIIERWFKSLDRQGKLG